MARSDTFSVNSLIIAAVANAVSLSAAYAESLRGTGSEVLFNLADRLGLIGPSRSLEVAIREPSLLLLTDEIAIKVSVYFSIYLALCAVMLAVVAERRGENNLYLSAGFIMGCCALVPISSVASVALMLVGAGIVLLLRRRRASEA